MKKLVLYIFSIIFFTSSSMAFAETIDNYKKNIIINQKKINIVENMKFTDEEMKEFLQVYTDYQYKFLDLELMESNNYSYLILNHNKMDEGEIYSIIENLFHIRGNKLSLEREFVMLLEFENILPVKKIFRYLQIEQNLSAIEQYQLVQQIPLLE